MQSWLIPEMETDKAIFLTLHIAGQLDPGWSDWFEGLEMRHLADGDTELTGSVADQAALYGLLLRARDLGLTLRSAALETAAFPEVDDS
jgi:hypothetical protein